MKTVIANINTVVLAEIEDVYLFGLKDGAYFEVHGYDMPFKVVSQDFDKENEVLKITADNNPVPLMSQE